MCCFRIGASGRKKFKPRPQFKKAGSWHLLQFSFKISDKQLRPFCLRIPLWRKRAYLILDYLFSDFLLPFFNSSRTSCCSTWNTSPSFRKLTIGNPFWSVHTFINPFTSIFPFALESRQIFKTQKKSWVKSQSTLWEQVAFAHGPYFSVNLIPIPNHPSSSCHMLENYSSFPRFQGNLEHHRNVSIFCTVLKTGTMCVTWLLPAFIPCKLTYKLIVENFLNVFLLVNIITNTVSIIVCPIVYVFYRHSSQFPTALGTSEPPISVRPLFSSPGPLPRL